MKKKVIISGSREFGDYAYLKNECDHIFAELLDLDDQVEIVSGTARGADRLGERYARETGFSIKPFPAPWDQYAGKPVDEIGTNKNGDKYWKKAGTFRNKQMADYADMLITFWDGKSRGTKSMIYLAKKKNLPVRIFYF